MPWAESESVVRSDCHGWSATPLFEIVGVQPVDAWRGSTRSIVRLRSRLDLSAHMSGSFQAGDGDSIDIS